MAPGWLNHYMIGHYQLEVANDDFNSLEYVLSYSPATLRTVSDMALCCRVVWHCSGALQVVNRADVAL
jgi:hypothetical protein